MAIGDEFQNRVLNYQGNPSEDNLRVLTRDMQTLCDSVMTHSAAHSDLTRMSYCELTAHCLDQVVHYDVEKGKAFNYFTSTALNYLRSRIREERHRKEMIHKYKDFFTFV